MLTNNVFVYLIICDNNDNLYIENNQDDNI